MKYLIAAGLLLCALGAQAADCYVSEYAYIGTTQDSRAVQVPQEPALAVQRVTYDISTQSATFNVRTQYIRVVCTARAHYEIGANPTSTTADPYVSADVPEYFAVGPRGQRISFYDGTS